MRRHLGPWHAGAGHRLAHRNRHRPALPPHLTAEYLEMTRGAIDFNRPGIPVVASLPSVHIAPTYGNAHHGRAGTAGAITAWAAES